jgi:hypothetical protein
MLAFWSPLFLSIVCLLASGVWLMLWSRQRAAYMLPTALSWLAFCAYFALLAVSAGQAPVVDRGDIAPLVRVWGFIVGGVVLVGKWLLLVALWRNGKAARREDST